MYNHLKTKLLVVLMLTLCLNAFSQANNGYKGLSCWKGIDDSVIYKVFIYGKVINIESNNRIRKFQIYTKERKKCFNYIGDILTININTKDSLLNFGFLKSKIRVDVPVFTELTFNSCSKKEFIRNIPAKILP